MWSPGSQGGAGSWWVMVLDGAVRIMTTEMVLELLQLGDGPQTLWSIILPGELIELQESLRPAKADGR